MPKIQTLPTLRRKKPRRYRRAIEHNKGIERKYATYITNIITDLISLYIQDIIWDIRKSGYIGNVRMVAQDANPLSLIKSLAKKAAETAGELLSKAEDGLSKISAWFSKSMIRDTSNAQQKATVTAGVPRDYISRKWTAKAIGSQYVAPEVMAKLPDMIVSQTNLIRNIADRELEKIQGYIVESLEAGVDMADMEKMLSTLASFDPKRAKRVALDQCIKLSQGIQRANDLALGFCDAVWIHVPGQYTSRESHIMLNGQRYDLRKGIFDSEVKKNIQCGELPFCRCIYRVGIPDFVPEAINAGKTGQLNLLTEEQKQRDKPKRKVAKTRRKSIKTKGGQVSLFEEMKDQKPNRKRGKK